MPPRKPARRTPRPGSRAAQSRLGRPTGRASQRPERGPAKSKPTKKLSASQVASGRPLYLVQTQPGVARLAWDEITATLRRPTLVAERSLPHKDDMLMFQTSSPAELVLEELRTVEDVFVVAVRAFKISSDPSGLKQIYAAVSRGPHVTAALQTYTAAGGSLPHTTTFRVIARAAGRQDFPRKAMGKAVADAISAAWPTKWEAVSENEQVEVWATLFGSELVVALRLSDASKRHRDQRAIERPAALRPAVAAAMVRLTEPADDDIFLDPMAGTGTIIVERAAFGPYGQLIAGDRSRGAVQALTKNLQPLGGDLAIRRLEAGNLPFHDGEISKIAVNLPFGQQVNHPDELMLLYTEAFKEWARVLKPGGLIVALASEVQIVRDVLADLPSLRIRRQQDITILGQTATIFQIERRA